MSRVQDGLAHRVTLRPKQRYVLNVTETHQLSLNVTWREAFIITNMIDWCCVEMKFTFVHLQLPFLFLNENGTKWKMSCE